MKVNAFLLLLGAVLLSVAGCSSVSSKYPLSSDPQPIDQAAFEGVWAVNGNVFHLQFGSNGVAQIAGMDWQDDRFCLARGEMIVTEGQEHNFVSVRFEEEGKWKDEYFFLSYMFSDQGDLIVWSPRVDVFEKLVAENRLEGVVNKGQHSTEVMLTNTPSSLLKFVDGSENSNLFNYKEPVIIRKLSSTD